MPVWILNRYNHIVMTYENAILSETIKSSKMTF